MIAVGVPQFERARYRLHEPLCLSLELDVREVPREPVELRCSYGEIGDTEQLLEHSELTLATAGLYRLPLTVPPPVTPRPRSDGALFVRVLCGARQFYQAGYLVHSGHRARTLRTDQPFVVCDYSVWHQ